MKDSANSHLKVQELCDCYSTTDPLKEMSILNKDQDQMDSDLKWLALLALHGVIPSNVPHEADTENHAGRMDTKKKSF